MQTVHLSDLPTRSKALRRAPSAVQRLSLSWRFVYMRLGRLRIAHHARLGDFARI